MIGTRVDPPLPLARLRVAGELTEVRADELRMTPSEARGLLDELGVELDGDALDELVVRSEGWAAGIQLAALSLRGRADPTAFVRYFTGTDRFVLDYLTEEVLMRQPTAVQDFLLLTSVLDDVDAGLAQAVTGDASAAAMLERVERSNLFLTPLDGQRSGYRYHAFFQDLLLHRLREARPDLPPVLHARAATELQRRGETEAAARHAWLGGDAALAARLLAGHPRGAGVRRAILGALGEPEAGRPLADLLAELQRRGVGPAERQRVLEALEADDDDVDAERAARLDGLDPLSERELEVLRLIAAGLPNKDIARRLGITLNTVKTHAKNTYSKLDVSSRTAAAARARELGLA
jgi:ATP/maltotriose-dependent transcriptional regulator MalT